MVQQRKPHPKYEPLVELLHGTLQLAALVLPLLVVAHRLHRGALPRSGPRDVVHKVNPPHLVGAALPAAGEMKQAATRGARIIEVSAQRTEIFTVQQFI